MGKEKYSKLSDIAWNVSEDEYRKDKAISYSMLSTYAKQGIKGLKDVLAGQKISTASLRFGSLTDVLLTDAIENTNTFNDLYIVADFKYPSDTVVHIVTSLFEYFGARCPSLTSLALIDSQSFLDTIDSYGYGAANWLPETKINKIIKEGEEYYNMLNLTKTGKSIVSQYDYDKAVESVNEVKSNAFTSWIFNPTSHQEVYCQLKFKINYKKDRNIKNTYSNPLEWENHLLPEDTIRCMLDIIFIDHNEKTIQPIDFKTTSQNEEDFEIAYNKWNYDIQSSMYSYILREVVYNSKEFTDYEVLPFLFLPINKEYRNPQLFLDTNSVYDRINSYIDNDGILHRAWYDILEDVRWHIEHDDWRYRKSTVLNNGVNIIYR